MDMTEARQQTGPQICDLEHLLLEQFFGGSENYARVIHAELIPMSHCYGYSKEFGPAFNCFGTSKS